MDSITHIAIGACIGEAFFEKGFGKKAMLWGVLAQTIPDIDFIASFWLTTSESLLAHRGFTHSFLFACLIIPVFTLLAEKIHRPHNISNRQWGLFFFTQLCTHLLLDAFNNYGIGWLEPFTHHRFSFNALYIVDPFFSFFPIVSMFFLIATNRYHKKRIYFWKTGILFPVIYLIISISFKLEVNQQVRNYLSRNHVTNKMYFSTPAPFQNLLWFVVIENDSGFVSTYYSILDHKPFDKKYFFPKHVAYLSGIHDHENLQRLIRFSQGYYTIEKSRDTLVFNDLRFGQINGWRNPGSKFVFHYFLQHPQENQLIIQKGRFSHWTVNDLMYLVKRVSGN